MVPHLVQLMDKLLHHLDFMKAHSLFCCHLRCYEFRSALLSSFIRMALSMPSFRDLCGFVLLRGPMSKPKNSKEYETA